MKSENIKKLSPSEFYRKIRPENFSDSQVIYDIELPREQLAFELNEISKNQKQDQFETLCRRLSEKLICPNLIPQVGPTGGGDGKTDTETYPVSEQIYNRWFIPENGWSKDEKWAFAFSAKKDWKPKVKKDIDSILSTEREYTKIYFITNQKPSSKNKKDLQDEIKNKKKIDLIILDSEWILENVYKSHLIEIVVDSLNLSEVYKRKKEVVGSTDTRRLSELKKLEVKINNPKNYFEYDYQLVEDSIEAAILSRMLEKPRHEVEGRFDRALRFAKKINNDRQLSRIRYQRAWTFFYWYEDFEKFFQEFQEFQKCLKEDSSISQIELYTNLINLLRTLDYFELTNLQIDFKLELRKLFDILESFEDDSSKPCSGIIASTYKSIQLLMDSYNTPSDQKKYLSKLSECFSNGHNYIDYPFENFKEMIERIGDIFSNSKEYDDLIDVIALISEKRISQLSSAQIFIRRGYQKLKGQNYKDAVIYFGKAVLKLSKEESQHGLYLALNGLSLAYSSLGLIWASNNCLIASAAITFKAWHETGRFNPKTYESIKKLIFNEEFIGRVPIFLVWNELFQIISQQIENTQTNEGISNDVLIDSCFAVRLINTKCTANELSKLPDIFEHQNLWLSHDCTLYKLGHTDNVSKNYKFNDITNEKELDNYFSIVANQPFINQIINKTNFLSNEDSSFSTVILGCRLIIKFKCTVDWIILSEIILAYFESFLSTSLKEVVPKSETITLNLTSDKNDNFTIKYNKSNKEYIVKIDGKTLFQSDIPNLQKKLLELLSRILGDNFLIDDYKSHISKLYTEEELNERLAFIYSHRKFICNILGENPKFLLKNWITSTTIKDYPLKRDIVKVIKGDVEKDGPGVEKLDLDKLGHNQRKVISFINDSLWDKAKWRGFGYYIDNQGLAIFLAFENGSYGNEIFKEFVTRFGKNDEKESIRITLIKGVDKKNPHYYCVHIGPNLEKIDIGDKSVFITSSRFREIPATSSKNLNDIVSALYHYKKFRFCAAEISRESSNILPFDISIDKTEIVIKQAWEITWNDPCRVVMRKSYEPIIPEGIENLEILEIVKKSTTD